MVQLQAKQIAAALIEQTALRCLDCTALILVTRTDDPQWDNHAYGMIAVPVPHDIPVLMSCLRLRCRWRVLWSLCQPPPGRVPYAHRTNRDFRHESLSPPARLGSSWRRSPPCHHRYAATPRAPTFSCYLSLVGPADLAPHGTAHCTYLFSIFLECFR